MSAHPELSDRPRVLFVDDEPRVLNSMRIMFRREYDTFFADNGAAALNILQAHDIDVIVCDHRMPEMTGVEVLSRARAVSPRSVRILLTGYADLDAVEGSINDSEVFRFLTKPCAPDELKHTIKLATTLAAETDHAESPSTDGGIEITLEGDRSFEGVPVEEPAVRAPAPQQARPRPALRAPESFTPTATIVLDPPTLVGTGDASTTSMAILVFTTDDATYTAVTGATRGRVPVYRASNIAQVVKLLTERRPGVLLTDISEDRLTIQNMTAKLKTHLPELVTVAVSEHRDVLDMVWLINHGQIFRFLRKPLSPGRCALSLRAALEHHHKLVTSPNLAKRHTVEQTEESDGDTSWLSRLALLRRLWRRK